MTAAVPPMTHWVAPGKFAFHSAQLCFEASPPRAGQGGTLGLMPTIVAFAQESIPRHVLLSGRSYGLSKEARAGSESTAKPAARTKVKRMDLFPQGRLLPFIVSTDGTLRDWDCVALATALAEPPVA